MKLDGSYRPNQPGARTISEARALTHKGRPVSVEIHGRKAAVFFGLELVFQGALHPTVTTPGEVNLWAQEFAAANA